MYLTFKQTLLVFAVILKTHVWLKKVDMSSNLNHNFIINNLFISSATLTF